MRHLFRVENIDRRGSNWPLGAKMCFFYPKIWIFGAKVNFLFSDRNFCWWNKWPLYPGLQLSHRNHPQKNFRFRARGHFLGLTPVFGRFGLVTRQRCNYPWVLVRFQRNWGEPGHQKNDPEPSTLSEQALRARALRARAWQHPQKILKDNIS